MSRWFRTRADFHAGWGVAVGLAAGIGMTVGVVVTLYFYSVAELGFPQIPLYASATHSADTLAVATGLVDDEVEGLYVLDYLTGELQCAVLNYRVGKFNSLFRTNVLNDLGIDPAKKRPNYLMVTGLSNFLRGSAASRPGLSVVYVVDANTGRFAAYGLPWRRELASAGRPQQGALVLLDAGIARAAVVRE